MRIIIIISLVLALLPVCRAAERETGDYNFDGHDDYRELRERNGRLRYYDHFLYDPRTKKHVLSPPLSAVFNPRFDAATREIVCRWPGGHSGALYSEEVYRWEAKRLVLVRLVSQTNVDFKDRQVRYVRTTVTFAGEKPSVTIEPVLPFE